MENDHEKITWMYMDENTPLDDLTGFVYLSGEKISADIILNYKGTWSACLNNERVLDQYSTSRDDTVLALENYIDNL